jgi:hypothetical protein
MVLLTVVARQKPWRTWSVIRTCINGLLAIGIALVAIIHYYPNDQADFLHSPWLLPLICLVEFIILILTHLRISARPVFFSKRVTTARGEGQHSADIAETLMDTLITAEPNKMEASRPRFQSGNSLYYD